MSVSTLEEFESAFNDATTRLEARQERLEQVAASLRDHATQSSAWAKRIRDTVARSMGEWGRVVASVQAQQQREELQLSVATQRATAQEQELQASEDSLRSALLELEATKKVKLELHESARLARNEADAATGELRRMTAQSSEDAARARKSLGSAESANTALKLQLEALRKHSSIQQESLESARKAERSSKAQMDRLVGKLIAAEHELEHQQQQERPPLPGAAAGQQAEADAQQTQKHAQHQQRQKAS